MSGQMNFEKGVNYKATKKTATSGEAEAGEYKTPKTIQFYCDDEKPKGHKVRPGHQMNFPNGN